MNEAAKSRILQIAHQLGLHGVLNSMQCACSYIKYKKVNAAFKRNHPEYATPPLGITLDACGHADYELYRKTGIELALFIAQQVKEYVRAPNPVICEWGCGPGRIIRHLAGQLGSLKATLVATDYNPESIAWCRKHIPGIRFECNQLSPPLPFPDGSVDFLFARSVFTHLDNKGWHEWLREMVRVINNNGIALLTTSGRNYLPMMSPPEREMFLAGQPVFRALATLGKKNFAAFHPADFVRSTVPPEFEILRHNETAGLFGTLQDIWILRKTCATRSRPAPPRPQAKCSKA